MRVVCLSFAELLLNFGRNSAGSSHEIYQSHLADLVAAAIAGCGSFVGVFQHFSGGSAGFLRRIYQGICGDLSDLGGPGPDLAG